MSAHLRIDGVSKKFRILRRHETALRFIKALLRRETLYRDLWALQDVSLEIQKGESVALIGRNGSGKSTLLRLIAGIYELTQGNIESQAPLAALFNSMVGFHNDLSVWDNIFLYGAIHGLKRGFLSHKMHDILSNAGMQHLSTLLFKELSAGQMQRLGLSIFLESPKEMMIFDESIAYVDNEFRNWCLERLEGISRSREKTMLLVSHDMEFLKKICHRAVWLEKGKVVKMGDAAQIIDEYLSSSTPSAL